MFTIVTWYFYSFKLRFLIKKPSYQYLYNKHTKHLLLNVWHIFEGLGSWNNKMKLMIPILASHFKIFPRKNYADGIIINWFLSHRLPACFYLPFLTKKEKWVWVRYIQVTSTLALIGWEGNISDIYRMFPKVHNSSFCTFGRRENKCSYLWFWL